MKIIVNKFINIEKINKKEENIKSLYKLFISRPNYHLISAKKQISFEKHKKFVKNNPYRYWFIIYVKNNLAGTIYFTKENTIGYFIKNKYLSNTQIIFKSILKIIKPLPKKLSVRQDFFTINISHRNKKYKKIFKKIGFELIQETFLLKK